ncbi:hypothetical protein L6164_013470 [Bauhinia variegata]|uniref:Uncharacterized protein n=1 Tax=Bauhinia variegata TaxID=167791 RepID=A0ACB9NFG4_BAUVA|nr:hypothetical protein L6164_013470 [Bauhinia variegata]
MAPTTFFPLQTLSSKSLNGPILKFFLTVIFLTLFYLISHPFISKNNSDNSHLFGPQESARKSQFFEFCTGNFTNYCPCEDPLLQRRFPKKQLFRKERHCPGKSERQRCLTPVPDGYRNPFPWPQSRDYAWFNNAPFPKLAEYKKSQNWVRLEGDRFVFPGGGTSFPDGVKGYVDGLRHVLPLESGNIRTALDVGCGVASFGASLLDHNVLTMSIAPSDEHIGQVLFALERGLPAMLGVLSIHRLPFPSRAFDMAHCSRCLVPWTDYDGLYLLEMDRVLRPGGYWVLSGPPINWRLNYKGWEKEPTFFEREQTILEDLARRLCWQKIAERQNIAVWQKPINHLNCIPQIKTWESPNFCNSSDADVAWYTKMIACIFPLPDVNNIHQTSGGALEKWPQRLNTAPPRIRNENSDGITVSIFDEDNQTWKRRVSYYGLALESLSSGKFRNVMDMNAGYGGFAAAMAKFPVWVMNVVPFDAGNSSLGVIYERGLIGAYMDWCEPFSTYPRSYDLIHAFGIFSMYMNKCDVTDILLEMHRILRPEGAVVIRDHIDVIVKVKGIIDQMRWRGKLLDSEIGPSHQEKVLIVHNSV